MSSWLYLALAALVSLSCAKKRSIGADAGGRALVPIASDHAAYVTNSGSDDVSVVNRDADAVTRVSVDVEPGAHESPHHLAIDAQAGRVFVALAFPPQSPQNQGRHAGHGRSEHAGALVQLDLASLGVIASADTDENPGDLVLTHDRSRVLVTHFDMQRAMREAAAGAVPSKMSASLQVWDARTMALIASRTLCVAPHGVVTTASDSTAFVACYGSDEIAVVDLRRPELPVTRVPVGASPGVLGAPRYGPYGIALSPGEAWLAVADLDSGDLRVLDVASREMLPHKNLLLGGRAMIPEFIGASTVLVPLQAPDALVRINLATAQIEKRVDYTGDACRQPHVVKRAGDGRVYQVCEGDHVGPGALLEIDPVTLETRRRWTVGVYPDGVAFGGP